MGHHISRVMQTCFIASPHNMGTKIVPTSWCERAALQGQYYVAQVCVDCLQEACKAIASLTRANQRGHAVYVVLAEGKSCSAVSPFLLCNAAAAGNLVCRL